MAVVSAHADVQVLVQLMHTMGVEPEELLAAVRPQNVPTFEEFVPVVLEATSQETRPTLKSYLDRVVACWGTRRLDEPTWREVGSLIEQFRATAQRRTTHTDGAGAAKRAHDALSSLYRFAVLEGILSSRQNPMTKVSKPRQPKSKRYGLSPDLLEEIYQTAIKTARDPRLDSLLLRLHSETAARPIGAMRLRLKDLNPDRQLITLTEKWGMQRQQPVSRTLMLALLDLAQERGVHDGESLLLRREDGRPLTQCRYNMLWRRVGRHIKVVETDNISTYWVRHTTLTWVERNFGKAVARAYAGHSENNLYEGATDRYTKAGLDEIATALQALTGEPHPLAWPESFVVQPNAELGAAVYAARSAALTQAISKIV